MKMLVTLAVLASACAARAAVVSYTSAPINSSGGNPLNAAIPQFDPALGTLTGATITLNMTLTPVASIANFSALITPPGGTYPYTSVYTDTFTGGATAATWTDPYGNSDSDNYSFTAGPGTAPPTLPYIVYVPGTPIPETLVSPVPGGSLSGFVGVGTAPFTYTITGGVYVLGTGDSHLAFGGTRDWAGTSSVDYTYTPIPEPGMMGALVIACTGLLTRRQKRC